MNSGGGGADSRPKKIACRPESLLLLQITRNIIWVYRECVAELLVWATRSGAMSWGGIAPVFFVPASLFSMPVQWVGVRLAPLYNI